MDIYKSVTNFFSTKSHHEFSRALFVSSLIPTLLLLCLWTYITITAWPFEGWITVNHLNWFFLSKAMHTRRSLHYRMIYMPFFTLPIPLILLIFISFFAISLQSFGRWTCNFQATRTDAVKRNFSRNLLFTSPPMLKSLDSMVYIFFLCSLLSFIACHFPISKALTYFLCCVLFWRNPTVQNYT